MSQIRLEKWKIFDSLSDQIKRSIRLRLARVFPKGSATYVTEQDEVFGLEANCYGCLGTGDTIPHPTPTRIDVLCGQKIQDLETNSHGNSFFAISSLGSVFAWGANNFGQLGLGTDQDTNIPTKISGILEGKKVVQVACGVNHSVALTSDGQVFAFGNNHNGGQSGRANNVNTRRIADEFLGHVGRENNASTHMPARVDGPLAGKFVTAIACQNNIPVALLDSGEVVVWDWKTIDPTNRDRFIPDIPSGLGRGVTISKITCGPKFTFAFSTDGKIYFLENQRMFGGFLPEIIASAIGRVIDIVSSSDVIAALTESNQIYIWRPTYSAHKLIMCPTVTSFSSLDEVFAPNTFRPLRPNEALPKEQMMTDAPNVKNEQLTKTLHYCVKQAFNDLETADFVSVVDGKKIHVHKTILMLRCVVFKTMFLGDWKECHANEYTIKGHTFDAFYALLKYFYTDELDVQPEKALECLYLAHFYQLKSLQTKCVRLIKSGVTAENAASIYDKALVFGSKELEDFVFRFCLRNMTAVVKSDGFKKLNEKVAIGFFQRVAQQGGFKS